MNPLVRYAHLIQRFGWKTMAYVHVNFIYWSIYDVWQMALGRPLFVRCVQSFFPDLCRRHATHTFGEASVVPCVCSHHADSEDPYVGRWYRAPHWMRDGEKRAAYFKPVDDR